MTNELYIAGLVFLITLLLFSILLIYLFKKEKRRYQKHDWKAVFATSKYSEKANNCMIAINPTEKKIFLRAYVNEIKSGHIRDGKYDFNQIRSFLTSKNGELLYINVRDVERPEWIVALGKSKVVRWEEILRQEWLGQ